jgi:hypothetical protein
LTFSCAISSELNSHSLFHATLILAAACALPHAEARPFLRGQVCNDIGGMIPFATTQAERLANHDPCLSLEERYRNHDGCCQGAKVFLRFG